MLFRSSSPSSAFFIFWRAIRIALPVSCGLVAIKIQIAIKSSSEVFFDFNKLSSDGTTALKNIAFSKDGKYMAYSVSGSGSDWEEIFVFDAEKKADTGEHIHWVKFSNIAWYKDGFFYSSYDERCGDRADPLSRGRGGG